MVHASNLVQLKPLPLGGWAVLSEPLPYCMVLSGELLEVIEHESGRIEFSLIFKGRSYIAFIDPAKRDYGYSYPSASKHS
jgi:hypothetical protein